MFKIVLWMDGQTETIKTGMWGPHYFLITKEWEDMDQELALEEGR